MTIHVEIAARAFHSVLPTGWGESKYLGDNHTTIWKRSVEEDVEVPTFFLFGLLDVITVTITGLRTKGSRHFLIP